MSTPRNRQPAGQPVGGQFSEKTKGSSGIDLGDVTDNDDSNDVAFRALDDVPEDASPSEVAMRSRTTDVDIDLIDQVADRDSWGSDERAEFGRVTSEEDVKLLNSLGFDGTGASDGLGGTDFVDRDGDTYHVTLANSISVHTFTDDDQHFYAMSTMSPYKEGGMQRAREAFAEIQEARRLDARLTVARNDPDLPGGPVPSGTRLAVDRSQRGGQVDQLWVSADGNETVVFTVDANDDVDVSRDDEQGLPWGQANRLLQSVGGTLGVKGPQQTAEKAHELIWRATKD